MRLFRFALGALFAAALAWPVLADEAAFSEAAARVIGEYFGLGETHPDALDPRIRESHGKGKGGKKSSLPPGLAKRDALPPGLAKMETLPPGLSKRAFPPDLLGLLPPFPAGTEPLIVGEERVVLVEEASGRVLDILDGRITKNAGKGIPEQLRHKDRTVQGKKDVKEGGISSQPHKLPGRAGDGEEDETTSDGEEISTDEYGRVKVKLPDAPAADGDPDRPVITGTMPNPEGKTFDKSHRLERGKKTKTTDEEEDDTDER